VFAIILVSILVYYFLKNFDGEYPEILLSKVGMVSKLKLITVENYM
jgi:hypothetical protein